MKNLLLSCLVASCLLPNAYAAEKVSAAYAIGMQVGTSIAEFSDEISIDDLITGLRDQLAGKSKVSMKEAAQVQAEFFQQRHERALKKGEAFLSEHGKKASVTTTASGLQYEVIKQGTGAKPKASDTVKVHYRGTLLDGTEFDSSYKRNEPAVFPLNRVIAGWTEGLQLMNVGSVYRFTIPSHLAYGERGAGAAVPPNSILIFDVELLSIESK